MIFVLKWYDEYRNDTQMLIALDDRTLKFIYLSFLSRLDYCEDFRFSVDGVERELSVLTGE